MPKTARLDNQARRVEHSGLDEASLVMPFLGPRVREEGSNTREWAGQFSEALECVAFDDEDVVHAIRCQSIDEIADAGCVHIDGEDGLLGERAGQFQYWLCRAEADVHDHVWTLRPRAV